MDLFDEFTDEEIYEKLTIFNLKFYIISLPQQLESNIDEILESLTKKNKFLLKFCQLILSKSVILILEEVFDCMDDELTEIFSNLMKKELKNKTILSITHKIYSVLHFNKVIVMDKSQIIEYDEPLNLIFKNNDYNEDNMIVKESGFAEIVKNLGYEKASNLINEFKKKKSKFS